MAFDRCSFRVNHLLVNRVKAEQLVQLYVFCGEISL